MADAVPADTAAVTAPGADDTAADAAPSTIISGGDTAAAAADADVAATAAPAGDWPADWREKVAGTDTAYLKSLSRYASPIDIAKKARSLEQKLSSGDYLKPFPSAGTPEEQATWRKEGGIPADTAGYVSAIKLNGGLVLGEGDKPVAESFAKVAHKNNWTPDQYNDAVSWYYDQQEAQRANQADADMNFQRESLTQLGSEYGPNTKREIAIVTNFLNKNFPAEIATQILISRDSSGRMLGDNAEIVKALNALAHNTQPLETLLPAGTTDVGKGAQDRLNELKGMMKDDTVWRYGPKSKDLQDEYIRLLEGLERHKERAA